MKDVSEQCRLGSSRAYTTSPRAQAAAALLSFRTTLSPPFRCSPLTQGKMAAEGGGGGGGGDSIEEVVAARQERLRALKAAHQLLNTPDDNQTQSQQEQEEETETTMKFRNYVPHDEHLQKGKLAPPVLSKFEDPVSPLAPPPPPSDKKEDPFVNIAPKKPNWELRRDVQKKLDKLERRTQKAMCKLMEQEKEKQQLDEDGTNAAGD